MSAPRLEDVLAERIRNRRGAFPLASVKSRFAETLLDMAALEPGLVALTADLMYATGIERFADAYSDRLFNLGIAEQNMTGVAAGLAACGKVPIVCGYAAFTTLRAVEQAKLDCAYNGVKVILAGLSAGLSYGVGGPTHQTYEDLAIMRAIPNSVVLVPSDPVEIDLLLKACLSLDVAGPIYVRLGRGPEYVFNEPALFPVIGQARLLRRGRDLGLVATGPMVFEALLAADALADEGVDCAVLNIHTVKPIDVVSLRELASSVRGLVVVEEHSTMGGLGAAVLEALDEHPLPVRRLGIPDRFPPIGPCFELRASLGLDALGIALAAKSFRARLERR